MKMHGVGLIQLNSPDGELEMTDPTRHWSDSPLGELEVVHPTRPMASWIGRPSLPLGELDVGRPTRPMASWTWLSNLPDGGSDNAGLVVLMLGNCQFEGLNDPF